ncbi:MAG: translocation/assembly module TamB domain-containing protein [Gammaproteobacteria bacterium]|nr:translocation/assembly module TamB domain-containing protein [Gammaproteobacteria bacterium]
MKLRPRRLVAVVAGGILVPVLLAVLVLAWVAATPAGSAWAVRTALAAAGPGYRVAAVSGRLVDTLGVDDLQVEQDGLRVRIARLELAWRPAALWHGEVHVVRLFARDIEVTPPPGESDGPPPAVPSYPALPLAVVVDEIAIENLVVVQDTSRTAIRRIALGARIDAERATLERLAVEADDFAVQGTAGVAAGDILALSAELDATLPRQSPPLSLTLGLAGRLDAVHVEASLSGPAEVHLAGVVDALATPPTFTLDGRVAPYVLDAASGDSLGPTTVHLAGTPRAVELRVAAPATLAALGQRELGLDGRVQRDDGTAWQGQIQWRAQGADDAPWPLLAGTANFDYQGDTLVLRHAGSAPFASTLDARVSALAATPRLDLDLRVEAAAVPPTAPVFELEHATLKANGTRADLAIGLEAAGSLPGRGPLTLSGQAELDETGLDLAGLHAEVLGGMLDAHGRIGLGEALTAVLDLTAQNLDLERADPRLAGRLGFHGALDGRVVDGEPSGRLVLDDLHGDWRGHDLVARAELERTDGTLAIRDLDAALGDNRVTADVRIGDALDGAFTIAARDLAQFVPELAGAIDGHGRLAGHVDTPVVDAELQGRALRYADLRVATATVEAALDLGADEPQRVRVALDGLAQGRETIGDLALALDGTPAAHTLHATLGGGPRSAEIGAHGAWADGAWDGVLDQLSLGLGNFGGWALAAPAALAYGADGLRLARACLTSGEAAICTVVPQWGAADGSAAIALEAIPLDLLADYLPTTLALSGTLAGQADVARSDGENRATAALAVADGTVRLSLADGSVETVPIPSLTADLVLDAARLDVVTAGAIGDWVTLDGALSVNPADGSALDGHLDLLAERLDWLEEFVPDLAGSRGRARLAGTVSGSMQAPVVAAQLGLEAGMLQLQATGMRLSDLDLAVASSDGRQFDLDGTLGNADGVLKLDGTLARGAGDDWRGRLAVNGEHVGVVRLPDVEADVSPDLELTYADGDADIRGSITLPRVHVAVRHLPDSAVEVSGDEVIVGADGGADEPRANFFVDKVSGDVEAKLGDDVRISAAGLEARLGGGLRWTKARGDGIGRGEGRVSIVEGGYEAYGQQLSIERGHLTFAGPIDNPALDVRAVRPDLDIVAGLLVSGDVRTPRFDLFSEPPLPDAEVLSYIITGEGLSEASSGEGKLIARAALSLGAERSSMVTSQVADAFGLDELSVNTGSTARETSFTAGKRIGPKLAVRSEFNPFDRLWSFFLNYKLTQHWAVEAESGVRQGADVIYSIEREELLPDDLLDPSSWFGD